MPSVVRHPIILHAFKKERKKNTLCIKLQHPISRKMNANYRDTKIWARNVHLRIDERMC